MTVEKIAQIAHEINADYCRSIGDNTQPTWENATEWQKNSFINGVKFHLENPDASPSASHESWLKQKEEEGWMYGEVKNTETKEHPCFMPYDHLPVEQKSKDYLFKQVVNSLKSLLVDEISKQEPTAERELTFGERLVGLTFNPSGDPKVQRAKELCAELADLINDNTMESHNKTSDLLTSNLSEIKNNLLNNTYCEILNAQMNAVKVLTFKY
jgi:hypothetical protein